MDPDFFCARGRCVMRRACWCSIQGIDFCVPADFAPPRIFQHGKFMPQNSEKSKGGTAAWRVVVPGQSQLTNSPPLRGTGCNRVSRIARRAYVGLET
jgi:hypothetical protein